MEKYYGSGPTPEPFEDETILERIIALNEMFPDILKKTMGSTVSKSKWLFSTLRTVTWFACSTAAILVLPISLETERLEYEQQVKLRERNIIFGPETSQNI